MSSRVMFRPLCWLIFGHEPIIEVNERENKSVYVCERCRAMLGDFVTNLRKPRAKPVQGTADSEPRNRARQVRVTVGPSCSPRDRGHSRAGLLWALRRSTRRPTRPAHSGEGEMR
jgi:hypothetical protein